MAKVVQALTDAGQPQVSSTKIYKAALGASGAVSKGTEISEAEAIVQRAAGQDVVVCGGDLAIKSGFGEKN